MPFTKETANDPKTVDEVVISYSDNALGTNFKAVASFQLRNLAGTVVKIVPHDLVLNLTAAQITSLKTHLTNLRAKATLEIIP